jgi:hypothetical protein
MDMNIVLRVSENRFAHGTIRASFEGFRDAELMEVVIAIGFNDLHIETLRVLLGELRHANSTTLLTNGLL